ncbi:MAG: hypothetical protein RLZZ272_540 [Actinomycetota bacterium]
MSAGPPGTEGIDRIDGITTGRRVHVVAGTDGAHVATSGRSYPARTLVEGRAAEGVEGEALVLDEPLSFWGGLDPEDGRIIDAHHPQHGAVVTGRVLVMPSGRGSSSASSVIAEALRLGTAPSAIVLATTDPIVVVGVLVATLLYEVDCPVVTLGREAAGADRDGAAWTRGDSNP